MEDNGKIISELNMKQNFLGKITELFINRYRMAYLLILLITVGGVTAYFSMPREQLPEIVLPFVIITTSYSGASPEDVETLVTDEIESAVSDMDGIEYIESTSNLGFSQVIVQFDSESDMDLKEILVSNELSKISLPEGAKDPMIMGFATSEIPLMNISVTGDYNKYTLTKIAEDIKLEIEKVNGVGNVNLSGGLEREIHIYVDPARLVNYGLSINSIRTSLMNANVNQPIGDDDLDGLYFNVRLDESFKTIREIKELLIETNTGDFIFLQDIAKIEDKHEKIKQLTQMYINKEAALESSFPSVYLTVEREGGSDVVGGSERIKKILEESKGKLYPEDITLYISNDQAEEVREDLADVTNNAVSGLIVVIIVLFIFIGFREALVVAFVIPLSLFVTLSLMNSANISLNALSILGLIVSMGLLVDNAIVVMENVDRLRHKGVDRLNAAKFGTNQVAFAIFAATLTTIAAFYPLAILPGTMGDFIRVIPQAIIFAIAASFVMSIIVTPTLCSKYLKKEKAGVKHSIKLRIAGVITVMYLSYYAFSVDGKFGILSVVASLIFGVAIWVKLFKFADKNLEDSALVKWYEKTITTVVHSRSKRVLIVAIGIVTLIISVAMIPAGILKLSFMPNEEPDEMIVRITAPQGTILDVSKEITLLAEKELYKIDAINNFNSVIGGNDPNTSRIEIELKDKSLRKNTGFELLEIVREKMKNVPGASIVVDAVSGGGPHGGGKPISVELTGNNIEELNQSALIIKDILSQVPGVVSPELSITEGSKQLIIDVNKNKALMMGLNPAMIASEVRSYMNGVRATSLNINKDDIDVIIKLTDKEIRSTSELAHLYLTTKTGEKIPMVSLVELKERVGISKIIHEDLKRVIKVEADIGNEYNLNDVVKDYESMAENIILPESVELAQGGDVEQMMDSFKDLFRSMILALILVYGILAVEFNSITQPFVIIMTVPMALIGVIWGLIITGNYFGFYGFMGLISLVGIAVNDAIVLVDYTNYLRKTGMELKSAIAKAGRTRFIPVFATSITTIGGILPLALKNAYYAQLGFAIIFGLMVATVLTLVYIPIFYSFIEGRRMRKEAKKALKLDRSEG